MNYFVALAGVLYLCGAAVDIYRGNYGLASVFILYAGANFILAKLG